MLFIFYCGENKACKTLSLRSLPIHKCPRIVFSFLKDLNLNEVSVIILKTTRLQSISEPSMKSTIKYNV